MTKRGRKPKLYAYKDGLYSIKELASLAGTTPKAIYQRINNHGYSVAEAVEADKVKSGRLACRHTYAGQTLTLRQWAECVGIPYFTLARRLSSGWTLGQALCIPTLDQRRRGVVSNFEGVRETGAWGIAQDTSNITFSNQEDYA